jgi:DNA-binding response OmpR family regulator
MGENCPTCNQPLPQIDRPIVDLQNNLVLFRGSRLKVSGQRAVILYELAKAAPALVRYSRIEDALWGAMDGPENPLQSISVPLCKLRKAIAPLGLEIRSHRRLGLSLHIGDMPPIARAA